MLVNLIDIIKDQKKGLESTIYQTCHHDYLNWPLDVKSDFKLRDNSQKSENIFDIYQYQITLEQYYKKQEYQDVVKELSKINHEIEILKQRKLSDENYPQQMVELRQQKFHCKQQLETLQHQYMNEISLHNRTLNKQHLYLEYKKTLMVSHYDNLKSWIPSLEHLSFEPFKKMPLFVDGLPSLKKAINENQKIGIMGGPCLYGKEEVIACITHQNGKEYYFDFSDGLPHLSAQGLEHSAEACDSIEEHIEKYGHMISKVTFINNKERLTQQEFDSMKIVFEFANILEGAVVIPLPDMSYIKYCDNLLENIDSRVKEEASNSFKEVVFKISDLYLLYLQQLEHDYSKCEVTVLHERNRLLCQKFYDRRETYITEHYYNQNITSNDYKRDSIMDYITMVALPHYFYGTQTVLQIDSIDETDSHRKCKQIHKNAFSLVGILYPEYISKDGIHTDYQAKLLDKIYMDEENSIDD